MDETAKGQANGKPRAELTARGVALVRDAAGAPHQATRVSLFCQQNGSTFAQCQPPGAQFPFDVGHDAGPDQWQPR